MFRQIPASLLLVAAAASAPAFANVFETYLCGEIKHTLDSKIDKKPQCISLFKDKAENFYHCDNQKDSSGKAKRTLIPVVFNVDSKEVLNFSLFYKAAISYFDYACDVDSELIDENGVQKIFIKRVNGCVDSSVLPILVGDFQKEYNKQKAESDGKLKTDHWARKNPTYKKLVKCQDEIQEAKEFYNVEPIAEPAKSGAQPPVQR